MTTASEEWGRQMAFVLQPAPPGRTVYVLIPPMSAADRGLLLRGFRSVATRVHSIDWLTLPDDSDSIEVTFA